MIDVQAITKLHRDMVVRWHQQDVDKPYDDLLGLVCEQFSFNFLLWHEEDIARSPDADDSRIAQVKRNIDQLNQRRNDWIEKLDDHLTDMLKTQDVTPRSDAKLNSETPGSVIDRLSILALRIFHMEEQIERSDATAEHVEDCQRRLAVCLIQLEDLSTSLAELLDDIFAGRKRHRTYHQLKMYNNPLLNPYIYEAKRRTVV